jgi:hypothetical protein
MLPSSQTKMSTAAAWPFGGVNERSTECQRTDECLVRGASAPNVFSAAERPRRGPDDGLVPRLMRQSAKSRRVPMAGSASRVRPREEGPNMTVSELIEELRAMPSEATVMLWSRMDDPQHRRVQRVELSTTKSDETERLMNRQ